MSEKRKIILIVDDEKAVVDLLAGQLKEEGYDVNVARDGYEALNLAQTSKPDLIILDVNLPKMDGFQVCRLLKYNEQFENIPVIMLTSLAGAADQQVGKQVGADIYLNKPYKIAELLDAIRGQLKQVKLSSA